MQLSFLPFLFAFSIRSALAAPLVMTQTPAKMMQGFQSILTSSKKQPASSLQTLAILSPSHISLRQSSISTHLLANRQKIPRIPLSSHMVNPQRTWESASLLGSQPPVNHSPSVTFQKPSFTRDPISGRVISSQRAHRIKNPNAIHRDICIAAMVMLLTMTVK